MPENETQPAVYTVTPGPDLLRRMGQTWTLFLNDGTPAATFTYGKDAEPPGPVELSMSKEEAEELRRDGYLVTGDGEDSGWTIDPEGDPKPSQDATFTREEVLDAIKTAYDTTPAPAAAPGEPGTLEPAISPKPPTSRRKQVDEDDGA